MNWRIAYSVLVAAASLLTLLPAPTYRLWMLALGVTEWGQWLALISLVPLLPGWRVSRSGRAAAGLAAASFALAWTPWLRAWTAARALPSGLAAAFGEIPGAGPGLSRPVPFSPWDALRGIAAPPLGPEPKVYATPQGRLLSLDLYREGAHLSRPGILVIHGGGWNSGTRSDFIAWDRYLAARGYLVADMDYRLAPQAHFPAPLEDVRAAITYLKGHAQELGLDPGRLTLMGRSAGGQLALLAAYDKPDPAVRGVVAFYAPNDLVFAYSKPSNPLILRSRDLLETYVGGPPKSEPGLYEKASPLDFVGPGSPPTLLIHGRRDELVWKDHSERLERRLAEEGRPHFYLRLPWATHGCDFNLSGPCGQLSLYAVERFLWAVNRPGVR